MQDDATQERLRTLTLEEMQHAVKKVMECIKTAKDTGQEVSLADKPETIPYRLLVPSIPNIISPSNKIDLVPDIPAFCFTYVFNSQIREEWNANAPKIIAGIAEHLLGIFSEMRSDSKEMKYSQGYSDDCKNIPWEYQQFLRMLAKPSREVIQYINKKTKVEDFISLVLADIREQYPEIYQQYQELRRVKTGDTAFSQVIKQTISYKYFSGKTKSFCPIYLNDIFSSPQYQAMGNHPKYQMMLLDMINLCNYLAGSRKDSHIETNGFHYTWSDCRVEVSEDTFQKGLKDIVARGWFKVAVMQKLDDGRSVKMYVPSTDWKKKRLSEAEIRRVQQYKDGKQKRLNDSRQRYRDKALKNECETEVKGGF